MHRWVAVSLVLGVTLLSGCEDGGEPEVTPEQAVAAVTRFDPADLEASIERLNQVAFGDPSLVSEVAPFLEDGEAVRRWAAVYVVALLVDEENARFLRLALQDPDPANRVIAAGSLAGLGVVDALPVLIEGLGSEDFLPYHDPPKAVAALAREALEAHTGQAFATPAEWEAWWEEVQGTIRWDGERYVTG